MTVLRLITHWGYDVVMYDSDAIVLQDPQPLFDGFPGVELVGSAGQGPASIGHMWGRTLCTGVLLLRSTHHLGTHTVIIIIIERKAHCHYTGKFVLLYQTFFLFAEVWWEKMSKVARVPFTDQGLVNAALQSLYIHWDKQSSHHINKIMDIHGSSKTGMQAVILSEEKMCRYQCDIEKRNQYYVWHKPAIGTDRTVEKKKLRASEGGVWFLRDDWFMFSQSSSFTDVGWLMLISTRP